MRRFILNSVKFLTFPVLLIASLELYIHFNKNELLSEESIEKTYNSEIANYAWTSRLDSLNILSGSSSVRYGLSCSILNNYKSGNFVNLAMDAGDPIRTYFLLKNLRLDNVQAVYFGLDPWIYTKRYYKHRRSIMYLDFSILEAYNYSVEHDRTTFIKRYKVLLESIFHLNKLASATNNLEFPQDFGSVGLVRNATNFQASPKDWFQLEKYDWSEIQFEYLKKISELCKSRNWQFSVFIPPKRIDFVMKYREDCKIIHKEYIERVDKTGFDSPIFGSFNDIDDYEAFSEAYHLNKIGQEKYSEIFFSIAKQSSKTFTKEYDWLRD